MVVCFGFEIVKFCTFWVLVTTAVFLGSVKMLYFKWF